MFGQVDSVHPEIGRRGGGGGGRETEKQTLEQFNSLSSLSIKHYTRKNPPGLRPNTKSCADAAHYRRSEFSFLEQ